MSLRSSRAEVRNPLIAFPSFRALTLLDDPARTVLRLLLLDLRADARMRAADRWRRRKPPMAAYWAAVGVYAGHAARALTSPNTGRGGGRAMRAGGVPVETPKETGVEQFAPRQPVDATSLPHQRRL